MRYKRSYQYLLQEIEDKLLIVHKDFFWILFFFGKFFFGFYLILATHYHQLKPILFYSKKILNPFFFGIKKFWSTH